MDDGRLFPSLYLSYGFDYLTFIVHLCLEFCQWLKAKSDFCLHYSYYWYISILLFTVIIGTFQYLYLQLLLVHFNADCMQADAAGNTPLHLCVDKGHEDVSFQFVQF